MDESSDQKQVAAARLGLRMEGQEAVFDSKSLLASLGGWSGIVESTIPATAFLVVYTFTKNVLVSVLVSGSLSVISIVRQLIIKKPVSQAIVGLVMIGISTYLATRQSGSAKDYFIPGFITNIGYGSVLLVSVLVRWPLIGLAVGYFKGWGVSWRKDKQLRARFDLVTSMWCALFGARLAVEVPLYLTNNIEALGITKLLMGLPLYALTLWFTWLSLRGVIRARG
jgi:hypothetical protein